MISRRVPPQVIRAVQRLESNGYQAYLAGGCVRDMLLGDNPNDYDIATSATPEQVISVFEDCRVVPTGIKHGTVTVFYEDYGTEITTFRNDGLYTDHRHPLCVQFSSSAKEDSARRDFTVNAMYYTLNGELLDYHCGREDLENGIIRCVGEPEARFNDDALRILRALRFSARFGFKIEAETASAIKKCAYLLRHIAAERILTELNGLFKCSACVSLCEEYACVFETIFGVACCHPNNLGLLAKVEDEFRLAVFLALYGGEENAWRLTKSLKPDKRLEKLVNAATDALYGVALKSEESIASTVCKYGKAVYRHMLKTTLLTDAVVCCDACRILQGLENGTVPEKVQDLAINGTDLQAIYPLQGEKLGALLKSLFVSVYKGTPNEKNALLQSAKQYINSIERI